MAKKSTPGQREQGWYDGLPGGDPDKKGGTSRPMPKFVRGELSEQEKAHVKAQAFEWDDIIERIGELVESGHKITVSKDNFNTSYAAWLTPQDTGDPNHGFILSGRGPSVLSALAVCFYKHFTKFDCVWPKGENSVDRDPWG